MTNMFAIVSLDYKAEYEKVLSENTLLKLKISELCNTNIVLMETIKSNELTIQQLKEENIMLKEKIKSLEHKIDKLENTIHKLELKDEYNKFMIAIQDINSMYSLERINSSFRDLREDRVDTCHYIKENDPQDLKDAKIKILYDKLQTMNNSIREDFDDLYPNVIDEVLKHLTIKSVSDKLMKRVNKWWD
jgi:hypothetical protein